MEKNKTLYLKRLSFTVILAVFAAVILFAQKSGGTGSDTDFQKKMIEIENDLSSTKNHFNEEITSVKTDIEDLKDSFQKTSDVTNENYRNLLKKTSEIHTFRMISAVSEALIAVCMLGIFTVFLLIKVFHIIPEIKNDKAPGSESENLTPELGTEIDSLKFKLDNIQSQLKRFQDSLDLQSGESSRFKDNLSSFQTEMQDNKQKIKNMEADISSLKTDINQDMERRIRKEEVESDPVAVYNNWAKNPSPSLPQYFTYVKIPKLDFRTKQEFSDTNTETDWIRNTVGEKKYLFPNPNKIDSLSGSVDKLYKVVGIRKSLGANSVKITNACQIKEGNFIEYQGELVLIQ